jgi:hypothetical protein
LLGSTGHPTTVRIPCQTEQAQPRERLDLPPAAVGVSSALRGSCRAKLSFARQGEQRDGETPGHDK